MTSHKPEFRVCAKEAEKEGNTVKKIRNLVGIGGRSTYKEQLSD
jgi:hypothetical protein